MGDTMSLSNCEWKEYKFLELLEEPVRNGIYKKKEFHGRGTKIVNMGELFSYPRLTDTEMKRVELNENERNKCLLKNGDLIFARRSLTAEGAGKCSLIYRISENITFESSIIRARPNQTKASSEFLYYYFNSPYGNYLLGTILRQVAVSGITGTDLMDLILKIPSRESQSVIASILSSLDDKIDLLHRQNKTLEALAETLFRQLFVEDKIWDGKLSEYIKVQGGYAFKSQDFRELGFAGVLKITNISMGSVDIINTQFVDEEVVRNIEEDKFRAKTGDFLIAMTGAEIGKIGMVEKTNRQVWVNQRVGKLIDKVPYGNMVGYLVLKSREGQDHIINTCSGSAQENISSSGIEEMDFVKYSEEIVRQFGNEVKPLFEKILFNMNQIRTLTQLRDTLLPKLMSGEIRLNCDSFDEMINYDFNRKK